MLRPQRPCAFARRACCSFSRSLFSSATRRSTPWFVDQETAGSRQPPPHFPSDPTAAEQGKPLPPDLPACLSALYSELSKSPHLERGSVEICSPPPTEPGPPLPNSLPKGRRQRGRTEFGLGIPDEGSGLWRWILVAQVRNRFEMRASRHSVAHLDQVKEGTENRGAIESAMRIVRRTVSIRILMMLPMYTLHNRLVYFSYSRLSLQLSFLRIGNVGSRMDGGCSTPEISQSIF